MVWFGLLARRKEKSLQETSIQFINKDNSVNTSTTQSYVLLDGGNT